MKRPLLCLAVLGFTATSAVAQTTAGSSTTLIVPVVAETSSYRSEVTLFNPGASAIDVVVSYYDANNLPTAGPKTCTPVKLPANRGVQFDLASRCTLEPGGHFGLLVLSEATLTQEFFGYVRTQNPQGIGFSTEGFPVEGFSDAVSHVIGLKRTAGGGGLPPFQTNCFVTSLGEPLSYELRLFDDATGVQIGSTVTGQRQPYTQYRFLDVFGPAGVNAPAGDYANVRAQFRNLTANGAALIGFCTVQDNLTFAADFRIGKSLSAEVFVTDANVLTSVDSVGGVAASSIALGADGLPVIGYFDAASSALKVAKCLNAACTASTKATVDSAGAVGQYPSITLGADGLPVISYYDATNGDLKVAKCGDLACSSGNTITTVDTVGDVGRFTSITLGADGKPVISYYDATNTDLKLVKCGNAACSGGNSITIADSAGDVGAYSSIARGADGMPVVSYHDESRRVLKVAKCTDANCTSIAIATAAAFGGPEDFYGRCTSIALGADGLPVISHLYEWIDTFLGGQGAWLAVTKCGNAACSSGNTTRHVDHLPFAVGGWTSIAKGADGLPIVGYYEYSEMQVAKCGDPACGSGNTVSHVDTISALNWDTPFPVSIALGADGLPVISYSSPATGVLKVLKCGNASCS